MAKKTPIRVGRRAPTKYCAELRPTTWALTGVATVDAEAGELVAVAGMVVMVSRSDVVLVVTWTDAVEVGGIVVVPICSQYADPGEHSALVGHA